jgi:hypothetical protein
MKLSPVLWLLFALAVGFVLGLTAATRRLDTRAQDWVAERDSARGALAMRDAELARRDAERLQWQGIVDSLTAHAKPLPPVRPTLLPAAPNIGTASDSAAYWQSDATRARARVDTLEQDNQALRGEVSRAHAELVARAHLMALDSAAIRDLRADRERLRALVDSAPVGRPGCRLLGLIPCPVVTAGYGATLAGTVHAGPSVTVGWTVLGR